MTSLFAWGTSGSAALCGLTQAPARSVALPGEEGQGLRLFVRTDLPARTENLSFTITRPPGALRPCDLALLSGVSALD
jgi:hypothetical protein